MLPPLPRASIGGGRLERFRAQLEQQGRYSTWVLVAALAGMFSASFPITILTVALGTVATEFGVSQSTAAWVIAGPMLLSAVALPLLGRLGDVYGHRRVFLLGLGASAAIAALTALAWDLWSLIGLRTLAAVLGGATGPSSMALIFGVTPQTERVKAMGWWSFTGAAAPALGLLAGGPLVDLLGWRVVFIVQAVLTLAALILAVVVLRETGRRRVRFDVPGALSMALGVAGLMWSLGRVREPSAGNVELGLSLAIGVLGLLAFVAIERRAASPLLPLDFFRRRNFTAPIISSALQGAAYMGAFVVAPLLLLEVFGFSVSLAAGIMLIRTASLTVASPLGGRLGAALGERGAALVGAALMTVSLITLAAAAFSGRIAVLALGLVLQGTGHGLALPSLTTAVANSVPEEDLGIASAASRLMSQVGASFGITLLALVYGGVNEGAAFGMAFAAGAVLAALSFLAALGMARRSHA